MTNIAEYTQLAHQAVETLKPVAQELGMHLTGHALWDWLKHKLHGPGAAALGAVAKAPDNQDEWEALEMRIRQMISKDPELAKELAALLPAGEGTSQSAVVVGDDNTVQQVSGTNNQVSANRGAGSQ